MAGDIGPLGRPRRARVTRRRRGGRPRPLCHGGTVATAGRRTVGRGVGVLLCRWQGTTTGGSLCAKAPPWYPRPPPRSGPRPTAVAPGRQQHPNAAPPRHGPSRSAGGTPTPRRPPPTPPYAHRCSPLHPRRGGGSRPRRATTTTTATRAGRPPAPRPVGQGGGDPTPKPRTAPPCRGPPDTAAAASAVEAAAATAHRPCSFAPCDDGGGTSTLGLSHPAAAAAVPSAAPPLTARGGRGARRGPGGTAVHGPCHYLPQAAVTRTCVGNGAGLGVHGRVSGGGSAPKRPLPSAAAVKTGTAGEGRPHSAARSGPSHMRTPWRRCHLAVVPLPPLAPHGRGSEGPGHLTSPDLWWILGANTEHKGSSDLVEKRGDD